MRDDGPTLPKLFEKKRSRPTSTARHDTARYNTARYGKVRQGTKEEEEANRFMDGSINAALRLVFAFFFILFASP